MIFKTYREFRCCIHSYFLSQQENPSTLVYQIGVQAQINVQVGEFLKSNKHAVRNKRAGKTSCKNL